MNSFLTLIYILYMKTRNIATIIICTALLPHPLYLHMSFLLHVFIFGFSRRQTKHSKFLRLVDILLNGDNKYGKT